MEISKFYENVEIKIKPKFKYIIIDELDSLKYENWFLFFFFSDPKHVLIMSMMWCVWFYDFN